MKNYIKYLCWLIGVSFLASCTTGTPELSGLSPQAQAEIIKNYGGIYKVGNPYQIAGRWYYPKEDYGYVEEGVASWYGEDFNGKRTANGERYNMNTLTAAHRTLPLPSIVKVTNLQNGRSIIVRVNDRGPYVKDRIIDLSKHGAQLLGYMGQGTTKVRVEVMKKESLALKAAMLNEPEVQKETALAAAESAKPAASLYETSSERQKISKEIEERNQAAIYASAGGKTVETGVYKATGETAEPAVYGSASSADGEVKTAAMGVVQNVNVKQFDNGIYAKAAANPQAVSTQAVNRSSYQYVPGYYYVQTGSFSQYDLAHKQMVRLKEYGSSHIVNAQVAGKPFYRVSVGPYSRAEEAKVAQAKLKYYGFNETKIEKK